MVDLLKPLFGDIEESVDDESDDTSAADKKAAEDADKAGDGDAKVGDVKDADTGDDDEGKGEGEGEGEGGDEDKGDKDDKGDITSHPLVKELIAQNATVMDQQLELQRQIADLSSKQSKPSVGDNIDAQLAKLDQDESVSVAGLRAVLADLKAEREQTTQKNAILSAQVQELNLKADPKYADYNEVVGDSARIAMQDPRTRSMILGSENPPLALYTLCKSQRRKEKAKTGDDTAKEILKKVRDARKTGRGAGQGSQGSRPKTSKGDKRTYEDLTKLTPAELAKVSDKEIYDIEEEAAQG